MIAAFYRVAVIRPHYLVGCIQNGMAADYAGFPDAEGD